MNADRLIGMIDEFVRGPEPLGEKIVALENALEGYPSLAYSARVFADMLIHKWEQEELKWSQETLTTRSAQQAKLTNSERRTQVSMSISRELGTSAQSEPSSSPTEQE